MHSFEDKLFTCLKSDPELFGLIQGSVLLAVSGGADSMAMFHAANEFVQSGYLHCTIAVGHINHQLRDDAGLDEAWVLDTADKLGIPCQSRSVDVREYAADHKHSIETAGRILRRQALMDIAERFNCRVIATAHHADDNAETVVHRLLRGTGFRGLAGIRPVYTFDQITFVRPLLSVTRKDIEDYCRERKISWRHDHTNACLDYTRNIIRHRLLPEIHKTAPQIAPHLCKLAYSADRLDQRITRKTEAIWPGLCKKNDPEKHSISLHRDLYIKQPAWIQAALFRKVLDRLGLGQRDMTSRHYEMVSLCAHENGSIQLPGNLRLTAQRGDLVFHVITESESVSLQKNEPVCMPLPGQVQYGVWHIETQILSREHCDFETFLKTKDRFVEWFDLDKLSGRLSVRPRRNGDRFVPLGQSGEKKVARYLIDARLSGDQKHDSLILEDQEKVIWVAPFRPSQKTRITDVTTRVLQVSFLRIKRS